MNKILIIGATSAIAESTARIWAAKGADFYLVGRDSNRLSLISRDLKMIGAGDVHTYTANLVQLDLHRPILDDAHKKLGKIDITLIAYGTLGEQSECEHSVESAINEIYTNGVSVISLLTILANYFELHKDGTLAVISSVAGDKGRASNYVYGSSKSMVTTFCSGLRQRLFRSGVSVVTIKPGLIDSPMTQKFKKGLLWTKKETAAKLIVLACSKKGGGEFYIPSFWYIIMMIIKIMPNSIFKRLHF